MISIDRELILDPSIVNSYAPQLAAGRVGANDINRVIRWANSGLLEEGQYLNLTIFRLYDRGVFLGEMDINLQEPGQCTFLRLYTQQLLRFRRPDRQDYLDDFLMWGIKLKP